MRNFKVPFLLIWPHLEPPEVYETRFSYQYCFRKTLAALKGTCIKISPDGKVADLLDRLPTEGPLLVVTDPETVIPSAALRIFYEHLQPGVLLGPVFNETAFPEQQAALPFPYLDYPTFEEVGMLLRNKNEVKEVSRLDPACFVCMADDLHLYRDLRLREIPLQTPLSKRVLSGALVHRFGDYYSSAREDLAALVPENVKYILDVGCARGGLGKTLLRLRPGLVIDAVEINPLLAREAGRVYHRVHVASFEEAELPENAYDLVVMGDVLEHLYDPWKALARVRTVLKTGGYFLGSVPNAAHWTIIAQLLSGRFEYIPVGLLCVSHIRFFTFSSLKEVLEETGFRLVRCEKYSPPPTPRGQKLLETLKKAGLGEEKELLTAEILFLARRTS
ncbi:bifunctional 2-polyprenyl-6-hydroxyphenol methylase/3-demethylubiquinol 3-O-methyltransferase UbiG [Thermosulfurimonas sp. F29]|uniref:class I SAM-dependent methyltransferase n=1 Tax=Thermosulfurimonas sp. F29 TaxID=2867247 RepID=UPI001C83F174|nr:class I SAM-dependent methyltransferase [Thermosulfurimonas sp. F29]MBX6424242.1 class I SAM-dependent methyltransferase [Thermosulfurimonas sp. F29]